MINNKVKLIKSSTMKCRLCQDVKSLKFNTPVDSIGKVIYQRDELEGELFLLEDFSILKNVKHDKKKSDIDLAQRFKTPISIRWDITYQCNFECRHCYSSCSAIGENILTTEEAKKFLDIFEQNKVQFVQILGGEPMVRKDIYELVEYALKKKYIFSLNSNGYLLDQAAVKRLAELGLKYIQISLHGFEEEHEYLTTRSGSFKKAVEAINLLIKSGVSVSVSCTVFDINAKSIISFLNYLVKNGVKNIQLLTPLEEGRARVDKIQLSNKYLVTLKKELIDFKNNNQDINFDLPGFDIDLIDGLVNEYKNDASYEFMFGCSGGVSSLRVNPEGKACICVGDAGNPIGDLLQESMEQIMKKMHAWRLANIPKMCKGCPDYLKECQGGCYLRFK